MQISRKTTSIWIESTLLHLFLLIGLAISMFPFYWMIVSSLKGRGEIFVLPPQWFVTDPIFRNYLTVFEKTNFAIGFFNTTFITLTKTFFILLFSAMGGFAFAKYKFPGREKLFAFLLGTMMIPGIVTLIPVFMIIVRVGWVDTYQALIIPGLASAFGIFLMRQYMLTIPDELMDAAVKLANRFKNASRQAIGLSKNIMNQSFNLDFRALGELEAFGQCVAHDTEYHEAAVKRFLNKEPTLFDWDKMQRDGAD